jgi:hypothetical protein
MGAGAFPMTTQDYTVTSSRRGRSSPSLSALCGHPRHCDATPGTVMTSPTLLKRTGIGRHHARHCTSYGLPSTPPSNRPAGGGRTTNLYAITLEVSPVWAQDSPRRPNRSKIRQDGRQLRGTARHAFVREKIVWHACKLPSPCLYKEGQSPNRRGDTETNDTLTPFTFHSDIGTCLNQYLWDLEDQPPLPPRLYQPSPSTTVRRNIVPRAHHC